MPRRENSQRVAHVLGNYEIFEELGRGGMGIVYRGLDLRLDRPVAVKVLRDELRAQATVVNRFSREARAAAALDHPSIVQIYSVGESQDVPYIAMEFVEAEALSALMIREGNLPWERAFSITEQVASALSCAHDAQIIHRDVKPPNILITPDDTAYVTDFGIAKILSIHDQLTVDGTKLGTPQYMSPERCKTGDATASSDLYSLGVLLFQMISGRLPHEGATATELIRRILSQPPARLRKYAPDIPEDVERMVAWLLERRPEHRPRSADEVREALERVRAGQPLELEDSAAARAIVDFRADTKRSKRRGSKRKSSRRAKPSSALKRRSILAMAAVAAVVSGWMLGMGMRADGEVAEMQRGDVSAWYVSKDTASFLRESDSIWIAHLVEPALRIRDITWDGSEGAFLLYTESDAADSVVIAIDPQNLSARALERSVSPAPAALASVSGNVMLAPDTRGTNQLWSGGGVEGSAPQQLSFLEGGAENPIAVSDDGLWVAAIPASSERGAILLLKTSSEN